MRMKKRAISIILCLCMIVCMLPVTAFATESKAEFYSKNYPQLTGDGAKDMVTVAKAQVGLSQTDLKYWEAWCADFIGDCATLAGQSAAVPHYGGVSGLMELVIKAGGKIVTDPKAGDLVFYYCPSLIGPRCDGWVHVGLMVDSEDSVQGNIWNPNSQVYEMRYNWYRTEGDYSYTVTFVRPNYSTHAHTFTKSVCTQCGAWDENSLIKGFTSQSKHWTAKNADTAKKSIALRSGPYVNCESISVANGTELTSSGYVINAENHIWYKVRYGDKDYYAYSNNLKERIVPPASTLQFCNVRLEKATMIEGEENHLLGSLTSNYSGIFLTVMLDGRLRYNGASPTSFKNNKPDTSLQLPSLGRGTHTISLTAIDSSGATQSKSLTLTVNAKVACPTVSRVEAVYGGKTVYLQCATSGAEIRYTTNGTIPSASDKLYTSAGISLTSGAQIRAVAIKGSDKSAVLTTDYYGVLNAATPEIKADYTASGTRVTISAGSDTRIWYSLDDGNYQQYDAPFTLTAGASVSAYAEKRGCLPSSSAAKAITVEAPSAPRFTAPSSAVKMAQNKAYLVQWDSIYNAADYSLTVYKNGEKQQELTTEKPYANVVLNDAADYTFRVIARNVIGESEENTSSAVTAVAPSTVQFVDYDDTVLYEQKVDYGGNAVRPSVDPERRGYYFQYWEGNLDNITEDTVIRAHYKIKTYTVTFYGNDGNLLDKQTIEFDTSAAIPSTEQMTIAQGYAFLGWNIQAESADSVCDLTHIDSNMSATAVLGWAEPELPIEITELSAQRNDDSRNGNYVVHVTLNNNPDAFTTALLRVNLKTAEGKMVRNGTESRTVDLAAKQTDSYTFVLNSGENATKVEAVVLQYDGGTLTGSAYSKAKTADVQVISEYTFGSWSDWSTTNPIETTGWYENNGVWYDAGGHEVKVETKTQYRHQTKSTQTGTSVPSGWTQSGSSWKATGSGSYYYASFPSGYNSSDSYYQSYNKGRLYAYDNGAKKRTVSEPTWNSYIYWHWTYPHSSYNYKTYDRVISDVYNEWTGYGYSTLWYAFESTTNYSAPFTDVYKAEISGYAASSFWWYRFSTYRQTYTEYTMYYDSFRWSDWSDWQDAPISSSSSRQVETRTLYRYSVKDVPSYETSTQPEDTSGVVYRFTNVTAAQTDGIYFIPNALPDAGTVDLADKLATIMVYKGKNSDPNESQLQYVGQTIIGDGNAVDFTFKVKDAPTINSGDYVVCMGVQGATGLINLGIIEAPKPQYTVCFYDDNGNLIGDKQMVEEGKNATVPEAPSVEGKTFVSWSETGRNVHGDLEITANYVANTYAVAFVDWLNGSANLYALPYGADLTEIASSMTPTADGHTFQYWDAIEAGTTTVTGNMVVSAVYEAETYTVNFYDGTGEGKKLVSMQQIAYGKDAELPDAPTYEDRIFLGWDSTSRWWNVIADVDVYAITAFTETTSNPVANLDNYSSGQSETLTFHGDENAVIYYTMDNTDPIPGENGQVYDESILLTEDTVIRAVATEPGKNDSEIIEIVFVYEDISSEYYTDKKEIGTYTVFAEPGSEIPLHLHIDDNPGLMGFLFFIECDTSVFYLDYAEEEGFAYTGGDAVSGGDYIIVPYENGWKVLWFGTTVSKEAGTLFSITLNTIEEAESDYYPITVCYSPANTITEESYENYVGDNVFAMLTGTALLGDVSGDGYVTMADVIRIAKYVVGSGSFSSDQVKLADVTGDGGVTNADVIRLAKYILGTATLG